ncbi:MAG: CCA tRNA nucleotidyltransferase [Candidatus Izemoplasmatales bacterium]
MEKIVEYGKQIISKLLSLNYEACFVGGFVRDSILNIPCNDIDIATNALPEEIEEIFDKTKATGKKYGTITVFMDKYSFELTTYRIDKNYINNRRPETVNFSKILKEDLIRRDFTINALARDINGKIIDLFNGRKDLNNKLIRAIDDPNKRFKEDALRILRAIRFVGKLDFKIEKNTFNAMKKNLKLLRNIASERIINELKIILSLNHIDRVYKLFEEIDLSSVFKDLKKAIDKLKTYENNINIYQLFALGYYPDKEITSSYWRFSKNEIKHINTLVELMEILDKQRLTSIIVYNYQFEYILEADKLLSDFFNYKNQKDKIINLNKNLKIKTVKDLNIKGSDIKQLVNDDRFIGIILEKLVEKVLLEKINNDYNELIRLSKELAEEMHDKQ